MRQTFSAVFVFLSIIAQCAAGTVAIINNGQVQLMDERGNYKSTLAGSGAKDVAFNDDIIVVLYEKNIVTIYDIKGNFKVYLIPVDKAQHLQITSEWILVTNEKGKIYKYDFHGNNKGPF